MTSAKELIAAIAELDPAEAPAVMLALAARLQEGRLPREANGRAADKALLGPDSRLLSAKQVAGLWNVPETWVRDQARAGKLPSVQLGRYVRFKMSDLDRYLGTKPERARLHPAPNNDIHRV